MGEGKGEGVRFLFQIPLGNITNFFVLLKTTPELATACKRPNGEGLTSDR